MRKPETETIGDEIFVVRGKNSGYPECTINGYLVDETVFFVRRTEARLIEFMKGFGSSE